ncbi:hypothetical protein BC830DRAFT_296061 [Chytriomyces sp. MP71]|nr:hypothetical protein BC830DRAFT_296061 [Chytriomyces sp. MP71]
MSVAAHLFEREQSVESALDEKNEALQEFARTYCFLLLHVSQSGMEPAKERAYFEAIYAITKDLCATLISLPSYNSAIDMELNRLFRGNLFCGTDSSNKRAIIAAPPAANVNQPKPLRAAVTSAKQFFAAPAQPRLSILPPLPVPGGSDFTPKRSSVTFSTVTPPTLPSNLNNSLKFKRKVSIVGKLSAMTKPVPNAKLMEVLKIAEESVNREKEEEGESASVIRAASVVTPSVVRSTLDEKKNERRMSMYDAQAKKWALAALAGKGRKKILLSDIRMARSPLADAVLPPPQRFLFL